MKSLGATATVDYRDECARERILERAGDGGARFVVDCIGSLESSMKPIARVVDAPGAVVAIMLPVVVKDSTDPAGPSYAMDVYKGVDWTEGVVVKGVRTHSYMEVSLSLFFPFYFL